jgi:tight adherence protein B
MSDYLPVFAGVGISVALLCLFVGFARLAKPAGALDDRLEEALKTELPARQVSRKGPLTRLFQHAKVEERMGGQVALELMQADLAITVNEYLMIRLACAAGGLVVAVLLTRSILAGLGLGLVGMQAPILVLHSRRSRRQARFQAQLVDVLSMLVSGLRAGVGMVQAMDLVRLEMPSPSSSEFGRVVRETSLGVPLSEALDHLMERMPGDDLAMVVTVIKIQSEVGGNLAQVLEGVITTIRERVRLFQEVKTLTAMQRITGYLLAGLPFIVGGVVMVINPTFMKPMFTPGWIWLPGLALGMMLVGFVIIRKVADIKV